MSPDATSPGAPAGLHGEDLTARVRDELSALVSRLDPGLVDRLGDESTPGAAGLALVALSGSISSEAQDLLRSAVAAARETGASWATIGGVLGISKQAAQQRFGKEPRSSQGATPEGDPWAESDGRIWRMTPVDAFDELPRLERAGRHGWHSIRYGILYHELVHSPVQWEHLRVTVFNNPRKRLEAEGWRPLGTNWFPWIYYTRPSERPAEGDGGIPE